MNNTTKFLIELGANAALKNAFKENPEEVLSNYDLNEGKSDILAANDNHKLMIFTPKSDHKLMIFTPNSDHKLMIFTPHSNQETLTA